MPIVLTDYIYWPYGANLLLHHYGLGYDMLEQRSSAASAWPTTYNLCLRQSTLSFSVYALARRWETTRL